MVLSIMKMIVCRRRLSVYFLSVFLFYPSYVNGEESTCKLQSTVNCTKDIVVTIDEKSVEEETSFSLYCFQAGEKKVVAVLNYDKSYSCHPTNGYRCTQTTDLTFNINLGCATLQNVTLVGDGQQPVTCIPMENTTSGNSVYHSRQKQCPCLNDIRKPDDTGGEKGNPEGNVLIGLITGITVFLILAAIVVSAVLYRRRKSIKFLIRKGYSPKYPDQDNEDL